jgi:hypothetical protein
MGVSAIILMTFLIGIVLLVIGFISKNKSLKLISLIPLVISIIIFLLVWNALSYM